MKLSEGNAPARAALAGNPSDLADGAVLALAVPQFSATVEAHAAHELAATPPNDLVLAAARRCVQAYGIDEAVHLRWRTSIPRGVGLGGSSALVIATLRALATVHGIEIDRDGLARIALAVEVEDLGIAAGLQDRLTQAYGGLVFMDFARGETETLDPRLLPPLVLAWRADAASESGQVHSRRERDAAPIMAALAAAAHRAREALAAGAHRALCEAVNTTFDLRRALMALDPRHVEMIECAREAGAAANYTGSGGAIAAVCRDGAHRTKVIGALARSGAEAVPLTPL